MLLNRNCFCTFYDPKTFCSKFPGAGWVGGGEGAKPGVLNWNLLQNLWNASDQNKYADCIVKSLGKKPHNLLVNVLLDLVSEKSESDHKRENSAMF